MTDTLKSVVEEELQKAYEHGVQDGTNKTSAKLDHMREMLKVQGYNGNWNYDSYMHGMYNGMEYMLAMLEDREPVYRTRPDVWLCELPLDKVIGDSEYGGTWTVIAENEADCNDPVVTNPKEI